MAVNAPDKMPAMMMTTTASPESLGFDAARIEDPVLSWIAVEASKPGRSEKTALTIHSRNDWAEANLERDRDEVKSEMLASLKRLLGLDFSEAAWLDLHRWRYASVEKPAGQPFLFDDALGLGAPAQPPQG